MAVLFKHVEGEAVPPGEINPALSAKTGQLITRAMAVEPEQRFQSFTDLRNQLLQLREGGG